MWWIVLSVAILAGLVIIARSVKFSRSKDDNDLRERLIQVSRSLCKARGNPYVDNYSDKEFLELYNLISHKFDIIAKKRGENITGMQKLKILNSVVYASGEGKDTAMKHLDDEIYRYQKFGIRE